MGRHGKKISQRAARHPLHPSAPATTEAEVLSAGLLHRYHVRFTLRHARGAVVRDVLLFLLVAGVIGANVVTGVWK